MSPPTVTTAPTTMPRSISPVPPGHPTGRIHFDTSYTSHDPHTTTTTTTSHTTTNHYNPLLEQLRHQREMEKQQKLMEHEVQQEVGFPGTVPWVERRTENSSIWGSLGRSLFNFAKGATTGFVGNLVKNCFCDEQGNFSIWSTLKTAAIVGVGAAVIGLSGGTAAPLILGGLAAFGAVTSGAGLINNGYQMAKHYANGDWELAEMESIKAGENFTGLGLSAFGVSASVQALRGVNAVGTVANATSTAGRVATMWETVKGIFSGSTWTEGFSAITSSKNWVTAASEIKTGFDGIKSAATLARVADLQDDFARASQALDDAVNAGKTTVETEQLFEAAHKAEQALHAAKDGGLVTSAFDKLAATKEMVTKGLTTPGSTQALTTSLAPQPFVKGTASGNQQLAIPTPGYHNPGVPGQPGQGVPEIRYA